MPLAYRYPEVEFDRIDFALDGCRAARTVRIVDPQICVTAEEVVAHHSEVNLHDMLTAPDRTMRGLGAGPDTTQIVWPVTEEAVEQATAAAERTLSIIYEEELRIAGTNVLHDIITEQLDERNRAVDARLTAGELGAGWAPNFDDVVASSGVSIISPMTSYSLIAHEADANEIIALLDEFVRRTCPTGSPGN